MHNKAHGQVPNQVIEVEPSIVESFLGRIEDPIKALNTELNIINDPAFRIIMVINLVVLSLQKGYVAQVKSSMENSVQAILHILNTYHGSLVKPSENNFLVSFKSVTNAVKAAFDIQALLKQVQTNTNTGKVGFKIGLSAGVPVTEKKILFEDTILQAERLCKGVKGEIILSSEVTQLFNSENPVPLKDRENTYYLTQGDEDFLSLLMNYMKVNWSSTDLKVNDLKKPMGCSKSQLYRKMISLTGKSPNTFINDYRLHEALQLLLKNNSNISEIAFDTGFSSPSYFSKCFQKRYGLSPSEYLHQS
jgi:AraC-like DNA-binding protein